MMSNMLGVQLVRKLEMLGLLKPGSVDGSDFDWIFWRPDSKPLQEFVSWFCLTISTGDILTCDEVKQYESILEGGKTVHGPALDSIAGCLAGSRYNNSIDDALPVSEEEETLLLQEELDRLNLRLKRIQYRKNQLGLQQLNCSGGVAEAKAAANRTRSSATQQRSATLLAVQEHCQALGDLTVISAKGTKLMSSVTDENSCFLLSCDLTSWLHSEQRYNEAVQNYLLTRCSQGDGNNDSNVELFQGNCLEMKRLHKLVPGTAIWSLKATTAAARHRAEAEEAGHCLERLKRGHFSTMTPAGLVQERSRLSATEMVLSEEEARLLRNAVQLTATVAEQSSIAALVADCRLKQRRQINALQQQKQVESMLVRQLSRQDCVSLMQQCESAVLHHTLQQLQHCHAHIALHHIRAEQRKDRLSELHSLFEGERIQDMLPAHLSVLSRLVDMGSSSDCDQSSDADVLSLEAVAILLANTTLDPSITLPFTQTQRTGSALKTLVKSRNEARRQASGILLPQLHSLYKLREKCSVLEDCLSGESWSGRLPATLPISWLPSDLLQRQADLETRVQKFKEDMITLYQLYEEKKKALLAEPHLVTNVILDRAAAT